MPIEETIAELSDNDKPLLNAQLTELSSLNSEELDELLNFESAHGLRRCPRLLQKDQ